METEYWVFGSKLYVKKGEKRQAITIYRLDSEGIQLTPQFRILNKLLNLPVIGIIRRNLLREPDKGTNFSTKYFSRIRSGDVCQYATFETLSSEDESLRLSRVVEPKGELIQLYQRDYKYKISYRIKNKSKCGSDVRFLYADFSQDDTNGAAYPLIDINGNTVRPVVSQKPQNLQSNTDGCKCIQGSFIINGYFSPLIVKVKGCVEIELVIKGKKFQPFIPDIVFPPEDHLILPVKTCFGRINVLVYENQFKTSTSSINRKISDEFRGVNSIIRGYHFSDPSYPCFESTGNIVSPPPYGLVSSMHHKDNLETQSDTIYKISSSGSVQVPGNSLRDWKEIFFIFKPDSNPIQPPTSLFNISLKGPVFPDLGYVQIDTFTGKAVNFSVSIFCQLDFKTEYKDTEKLAFRLDNTSFISQTLSTCKCPGTSCPSTVLGYFRPLPDGKARFEGDFKFNNYDNKSFIPYVAGLDVDELRLNEDECYLIMDFKILEGPPCDSN